LTQAAFAARYGFAVGTLRDWEQGRKQPEPATRTLSLVIEHDPELVAGVVARHAAVRLWARTETATLPGRRFPRGCSNEPRPGPSKFKRKRDPNVLNPPPS